MKIDTHCHIQFQAYTDDRDAVIARCKEKRTILNLVGTQKDTSTLAVELAEQYDWMYASIGTHPIHLHPTHVDEEETHFMSREEEFDEPYYEQLVQSKKVIGIGECGLDLWHVPKDVPVEHVLQKQKKVFINHANFAHKHGLPLVIHCREAHEHMVGVLEGFQRPIQGTVHCFTANWGFAEKYLALGLHLGFTGVITFPPKKTDPRPQEELLEVVKNIPLDRVVVETDSPYLAPQAYRGTRSEPWMVEEVIKKIAEIKGLSVETVEKQVEENTRRLFTRVR